MHTCADTPAVRVTPPMKAVVELGRRGRSCETGVPHFQENVGPRTLTFAYATGSMGGLKGCTSSRTPVERGL